MGSVYSFNRASQAPPGYKPRKGMGYGAYGVLLDDPMSTKRSGGYVHDWSIDPRGGSRMDLGWTWERMIQEHRYRQVADTLANLLVEARAIGAHGVIGIEFDVRNMQTNKGAYPLFEMSAHGTAVRVPGLEPNETPFTTGLNGSDIAKLSMRGYAPSSFLVGFGIVSGQLGAPSRRRLRGLNNGEVEQFSEVNQQAFTIARRNLQRESVAGSHLVIAGRPQVRAHHEFGGNYSVTVRISGSVVRRFGGKYEGAPLDFMTIVSANDDLKTEAG